MVLGWILISKDEELIMRVAIFRGQGWIWLQSVGHISSGFSSSLTFFTAILSSNKVKCRYVLRRFLVGLCWINMHIVLWSGGPWETFWRDGSRSRCTSRVSLKWECQISDTVSFKKKRKQSRVKHTEGEICSCSFIWHGSFVILWEIFYSFCFCPRTAIEVRRGIFCNVSESILET